MGRKKKENDNMNAKCVTDASDGVTVYHAVYGIKKLSTDASTDNGVIPPYLWKYNFLKKR